jgi:hypothetical protein
MTTKVNGAVIEWDGYEYARVVDGEPKETGNLDFLKARQDVHSLPGMIMFRARYVTEWWPVSPTSSKVDEEPAT